MSRALPLGAALAASLGFAAHAQPATGPAPSAAPPSVAAPAPALKSGMAVKDTTGAVVGSITQVGKTADGTAAVVVNIDGKPVGLPASMFTLAQNGSEVVSSATKAQIQAAAAAPAPKPG